MSAQWLIVFFVKLSPWLLYPTGSYLTIKKAHFLLELQIREEWPSALRYCDQNQVQKISGSKLTRNLTGLRDTISIQESRWPSGQKCENTVINIEWVRLPPPPLMARSWSWRRQIAGKKKIQHSNYKIAVSETVFKQEFVLHFSKQNLFSWKVIFNEVKLNWKNYALLSAWKLPQF